ncbi:uncharacterized protein Z520_03936 [Fonsecaea multimorphosa CBS 102226]|uniref:Uncharacterized protein n=1 Tax=Fonsecaea multimorphosa CBS 102226 TaxID=1442371 RepID=A0A0D2HED4_9EURO|nr:uncharacterized protein Z520_03936 [Fonsecaea multimorphosa CBS 102226]KIY00251.1 hypothetical protein Z520_03936 [Fonsecaea multimorphosa CBS 102226]OAL27087.1 hypothetical protein AYO22_03718 [Fonsecaea multimorphosa]
MDKPPPSAPPSSSNKNPSSSHGYVSSSGHILETPPLSARILRLSDSLYNFLGLYFVSLFSLDPYTAAQNSQFNTRGRPNAYQERPRWSGGGTNRLGGGGGGSSSTWGRGGGGGGSSGGNGGTRRMGGIDDVRAPECGSCG